MTKNEKILCGVIAVLIGAISWVSYIAVYSPRIDNSYALGSLKQSAVDAQLILDQEPQLLSDSAQTRLKTIVDRSKILETKLNDDK